MAFQNRCLQLSKLPCLTGCVECAQYFFDLAMIILEKLLFANFRYDYETVKTEAAKKVIEKLHHIISDGNFVGTKLTGGVGGNEKTYEVKFGDDFYYEDPIDGSIAKEQVKYIVTCNSD